MFDHIVLPHFHCFSPIHYLGRRNTFIDKNNRSPSKGLERILFSPPTRQSKEPPSEFPSSSCRLASSKIYYPGKTFSFLGLKLHCCPLSYKQNSRTLAGRKRRRKRRKKKPRTPKRKSSKKSNSHTKKRKELRKLRSVRSSKNENSETET